MKEETILERKAIRLWSRSHLGRVVHAVQFESSGHFGDRPDYENRPIYVGFDGYEPRDLEEVLLENEQLRKHTYSEIDKKLNLLRGEIEDAIQRANELHRPKLVTKKWYQFWK